MPTNKKRLNITLSKETEEALKILAEEDNTPQATKAVELLEDALALHEDLVLGEIAEERLQKKGKTFTHAEVWKILGGE